MVRFELHDAQIAPTTDGLLDLTIIDIDGLTGTNDEVELDIRSLALLSETYDDVVHNVQER